MLSKAMSTFGNVALRGASWALKNPRRASALAGGFGGYMTGGIGGALMGAGAGYMVPGRQRAWGSSLTRSAFTRGTSGRGYLSALRLGRGAGSMIPGLGYGAVAGVASGALGSAFGSLGSMRRPNPSMPQYGMPY